MENQSQKFKLRLGLFIIAGVLLFFMAIFIIGKQKNLFNPVFKLTTNFYNVSGLQVGSNIRFSGINIGTVDNIKIINDTTVRVDMLIKKNIQQFIKTDCEAGIGSSGIIGDRILIITQGSSEAPIVTDGQYIASNEPIETDAIIKSLQISAGSVEIISLQLSEIMLKINSGYGTLGRLIHDTIVADNLDQIIINFKKSSEGLDETIDSARRDLSVVMASLKGTVENTVIITQSLENIMMNIENGNGTLGKLINDSTIAENINMTIDNLRKSSLGLNENMNAAKENILLRGYFRRKEKEAENKKENTILEIDAAETEKNVNE